MNYKDLKDQRFGRLVAVEIDHVHTQPKGGKVPKWLCVCDCGSTTVVSGPNLLSNHTLSCGCLKKEKLAKARKERAENHIPEDIVGERFGFLTVLGFDSWTKPNSAGARTSKWKCACDCGKEIVNARCNFFDNSSCGCKRSEILSAQRTTHGMTNTPTYRTWLKMKERCYYKNYVEKEYYQENNIQVCERWKDSFENFLEDMGERPAGTSLDRIDGKLGYYKENCRWVDSTIQAFNTKLRSNNTSGRTGVTANKNGGYNAYITYYKEHHILATGVSFEDAVKAREEAELKYYGWTKE